MRHAAPPAISALAACLLHCAPDLHAQSPPAHAPVPATVRKEFSLAPFYAKHIDVEGCPIIGSPRISDAALAECAWIVRQMIGHRTDILHALAASHVRFAVMAHDEYTTDIPEHSQLSPAIYWDRRARGLGATKDAPAVSAAEENLLSFPGDPYPREIIAIHEFAHAIHEMALNSLDSTFDTRLRHAYQNALSAQLWKGTYAAVNHAEYWAEAVQDWFDNNASNDALHNHIHTRAQLKDYDPPLAALCAEVFGERPWRYTKPADRPPAERAHLANLPTSPPRFHWRSTPLSPRPRALFQCADAELEIEIPAHSDPALVSLLFTQILEGYFSGGRAAFTDNTLHLTPAAQLPDGSPLPDGTPSWTLLIQGANEPTNPTLLQKGMLPVHILKGAHLLAQLLERSSHSGPIPVQRIVRVH